MLVSGRVDGNRTSQQLIVGVGDLKNMVLFLLKTMLFPWAKKQGGEPAGSTSMFYL